MNNSKKNQYSGLKEAIIATICTIVLIYIAIEYLYFLDKKNWEENKIKNTTIGKQAIT